MTQQPKPIETDDTREFAPQRVRVAYLGRFPDHTSRGFTFALRDQESGRLYRYRRAAIFRSAAVGAVYKEIEIDEQGTLSAPSSWPAHFDGFVDLPERETLVQQDAAMRAHDAALSQKTVWSGREIGPAVQTLGRIYAGLAPSIRTSWEIRLLAEIRRAGLKPTKI